jgi:hypothetical protein
MEHITIISIVVIILGWNLHNMCFGNLPTSTRALIALAVAMFAVAIFFAPFLVGV